MLKGADVEYWKFSISFVFKQKKEREYETAEVCHQFSTTNLIELVPICR